MSRWLFIIALVAAVAVAACATTMPAREVKPSGFLGADAKLLGPGGPGEAALVYKNPLAKWASYDKMLLDPVTFWRAPGSKQPGISRQDMQTLINYFYHVIYQTFSGRMKMVTTPQPGTVRVKVAITKAEPSVVALDIISTVVPQMLAVSSAKMALDGKPAFVGEAAIAVKITDAMTGELLAAAVADRVGGKQLDAAHLKSWGDVEAAMQFWAQHAVYNLCLLQEKLDCKKPADQ